MTHKAHKTVEQVVLEPTAQPATAAVIWLHGLGADGNDFVPIVPELALPSVRFVFPHAPLRPVTINNGHVMRAWHDIKGINRTGLDDVAGIEHSAQRVQKLINEQIDAGIPPHKIALVGFSQGGAMALYLGLRQKHNLAVVMGLSTYLPLAALLQAEGGNRSQAVWMAHGSHDNVVPLVLGSSSKEIIEAAGYTVQWQEYPMAHQVCEAEIEDLATVLQQKLLA
jgi:phospholipase/carboxylesterase